MFEIYIGCHRGSLYASFYDSENDVEMVRDLQDAGIDKLVEFGEVFEVESKPRDIWELEDAVRDAVDGIG